MTHPAARRTPEADTKGRMSVPLDEGFPVVWAEWPSSPTRTVMPLRLLQRDYRPLFPA